MGECEALAVGVTATTTTPTTTPKSEPRLKPVRGDPKSGPATPPAPKAPTSTPTTGPGTGDPSKYDKPKSEVPCKFFGKTMKGCARGNRCPFAHSWEGLEKKDRCLACGGKGHMQKECPSKKFTPPSSQGGTPKAGAQKPPTTPSSSTTTTKTVRIEEKPESVEVNAPAGSEGNTVGSDLRDVLADVGRVLKSMSATTLKKLGVAKSNEVATPRCAAVQQKAMLDATEEDAMGSSGLLDTGASHAMRPATSEEYDVAQPVKVTLAGEDEKILRQNPQGTILVQEEETKVQPIVPLGALIEGLGYTLHWSPSKLRLTHPEKGTIRVRVNNHCPEVAACDALAMIRELELKQVNALNSNVETLKARLEVVKLEEKRGWTELLGEYATTGNRGSLLKVLMKCPFTKDLPTEVQALMLESFDLEKGEKYLKALPITRRHRRALMVSRKWVVNLQVDQVGGNKDPFQMIPQCGKVVLNVNPAQSKLWDLNRPSAVYQALLWAAATGRISDVLGSPTNETWINSSSERRGPSSYPKRTQSEPHGRHELPPLQRQQLDQETAVIAKQMLLWSLASMSGKGPVGFMMELPADEERLRECDPHHVSVWELELWKAFKSVGGMRMVSFNMGVFGHKGKRPTTIGTNYPDFYDLDGNWDFADSCVPSSLVSKEEKRQWPLRFRALVVKALKEGMDGSFAKEEELIEAGAKVSKLSKEQKAEWQQHLLNDHQPYRADCSVCINAQAYGYQHRRRKMPGLYSLALDLAGPFKQKGRDTEFDDYKYVVVAAYRCPREYMSATAIPEYEKELYVPDEPEELSDDPLELDLELDPGDKLSGGEESDSDPIGPETLEEAVEKLNQGEETATIYVTRPLRRRTAHHVLQAAKEILLQLRQSGLHVDVVHTDRAREFKAKSFKEWTVDSKLRHTKTAGGDPPGNSTAELGVKWAKSRMRALLKGAKVSAKEWPMAVNHASSSLWAKAFPFSPWTTQPATTFGNEVWFRSKVYQGKAEKKHEAVGTRWKKGLSE